MALIVARGLGFRHCPLCRIFISSWFSSTLLHLCESAGRWIWTVRCVDRKIVASGAFSSFPPVLYQPDGSFMLFPLYLGPGTRGQSLRGSRAALSRCKQSVSARRLNTIQKKLELFSCPPSVDSFCFHVRVQSKNSTLEKSHCKCKPIPFFKALLQIYLMISKRMTQQHIEL